MKNQQNPATVATLINTTRSNETVMVITELQLTASAMYPNSHVSCKANGPDHEPVISSFRKSDINMENDLMIQICLLASS